MGESGCGKSVTALSILGLVPIPPGRFDSGAIRFRGEDLLRKSEREMQHIRGNDIAMVFQDPMASLNPVFPVGDQIAEAVELHQAQPRAAAAAAGGGCACAKWACRCRSSVRTSTPTSSAAACASG